MALRTILRYPDNGLRLPTAEITEIDDALRHLVADMIETMYSKNGAGLAAIQLGVNIKLFIVEASITGGDVNDLPVVFINPTIEWLSSEVESSDEGCLSFPGIYVPVKRALKARVRAVGLDGREFLVESEGLYARALQHENDHLDNKLLIDHVGPLKKKMIKRKLERMTDEEAAELQSAGD